MMDCDKYIPSDLNRIDITGFVIDKVFSHSCNDEDYYCYYISISRLGENKDVLKVIVPHRAMLDDIDINDTVVVNGSIRSRSVLCNQKNKLEVFMYGYKIHKILEEQLLKISDNNIVMIDGYICRQPSLRYTHSNRIICSSMIACNRTNNSRADFIPFISWGNLALFTKEIKIGSRIHVEGRLQSRTYIVKDGDDFIDKTVYEISASAVVNSSVKENLVVTSV